MKTCLHSFTAKSHFLCLFMMGSLALPVVTKAHQPGQEPVKPPFRAADNSLSPEEIPSFLTIGQQAPREGQPVEIYPNPTTGFITIRSKQILTGSRAIINNENKEVVYYTMLETNTMTLPDMLPSGDYVIQVTTPGGKLYEGKVTLEK
ncbi:T9SS type A sorting domain-containing protein [Chitinophaga pendula]|uniref:T9SS type A sorting domain-containing protein n=1 Tax=Chitinophaga TaxID=79328 RepID=UPI000BAFDEBA|nr:MULTISPECIES: T9SS type A sorting domain-containing protein [Chitinophaga]ASZ12335.1 hypothetical protein CK934_15890 [Chitinophaga sp. MD30]UCJ10071.1 T9SS type A sorting domain-containing protein [Chitinophaga pendula]